MLARVLEPEAMDTPEEARDYDAMDHAVVNARFVADFVAAHGPSRGGAWLDVGTGPARIPIALCQADHEARIVAIDLAESMLERARRNVAGAGLRRQIWCEPADAKALPYPDAAFEAVLSNTIIHHIPEPGPVLAEMARVVAPGGTVFVRDLVRPADTDELDRLVQTYAGHESPAARDLFRASLLAALSLKEIRQQVKTLGLDPRDVSLTSDRHWTWAWRRPI